MKVLLISQYFWPEGFAINSIVARLVEKGHQVTVLTGKPNYPRGEIFSGYSAWGCTRELYRGADVHRVPLSPRKKGAAWLAWNYLSFVVSASVFGPRQLRGQEVDFILVYAPSPVLQALPALYFGWKLKRPVVLWVQDLWPESLSATGYVKNRTVLQLVEQLVRFIYRHCCLLLVQSEAFIAPVRRLAPGTEIAYVPNSVDDSFAARAINESPSPKSYDFTVLFAGNLGSAQAVECILEAAWYLREHPRIRFLLVGDGSRLVWMKGEIERLSLINVALPGRFPSETMPALMQQASVLLVTLAAQRIFAYTVPSKVQAYMAAGRPIVAALNGEGARLMRESGAGLAVPAEDAAALAQAILTLHDMPFGEREALGRKGREYYMKHFREDMVVD